MQASKLHKTDYACAKLRTLGNLFANCFGCSDGDTMRGDCFRWRNSFPLCRAARGSQVFIRRECPSPAPAERLPQRGARETRVRGGRGRPTWTLGGGARAGAAPANQRGPRRAGPPGRSPLRSALLRAALDGAPRPRATAAGAQPRSCCLHLGARCFSRGSFGLVFGDAGTFSHGEPAEGMGRCPGARGEAAQ